MSLSEGDLQYIGQYVRAELPGWLRELGPWAFGSQLMERMVRVEEELKSQRELLLTHVRASDRRFEDVNRRFDDVNERFEDVNKRFDDVNERFEDVNKRFDDVNERFEDVNKRFDDVSKRFDDVNRRFDDNSKRHTATQWTVGVGFVVLTTLVTLYQFLG
jgi:chaperonin cofactor prefoldin